MNLPFSTHKNVNTLVTVWKNFFNIKIFLSWFNRAMISFLPLPRSTLCFLILNKEILCGFMLKAKGKIMASIMPRHMTWQINTAFSSVFPPSQSFSFCVIGSVLADFQTQGSYGEPQHGSPPEFLDEIVRWLYQTAPISPVSVSSEKSNQATDIVRHKLEVRLSVS